jgi:hypothetical protein
MNNRANQLEKKTIYFATQKKLMAQEGTPNARNREKTYFNTGRQR